MRWGEVRRFDRDQEVVRLVRGQTVVPVPRSSANLLIPRRRWRVEVNGPNGVEVVLETRPEAEAWSHYRERSGDLR